MKVTLNNQEIEQAVEKYINDLGINTSNQTVSIDFTAGRGENGLSADINITKSNGTATPGDSASPEVTSEMEEVTTEENSGSGEELNFD